MAKGRTSTQKAPADSKGDALEIQDDTPDTTNTTWLNISPISAIRTGAIVVFVGSALTVAIITIIGVIGLEHQTTESYAFLRSVELVLKILGTSAIILLILTTDNVIAKMIGFLVIAGLIVGTADIIRISLLVMDSDREFQDFFVKEERAETSSQIAFNAEQLANSVLELIEEQMPNATIHQTDSKERSQARKQIKIQLRDLILQERNVRLMRRIQQSNAIHSLGRFAAGDTAAWTYRYGKDQRFVRQAELLRREGLITFVFDDLDSIAVTDLGCQILDAYDDVDYKHCEEITLDEGETTIAASSPTTVRREDVRRADIASRAVKLSGSPFSPHVDGEARSITIRSAPTFFEFSVSESGSYEIYVDGRRLSDPIARLFLRREDADGNLLVGRENALDMNDDWGNSFNSRLLVNLEENERYLLEVSDLDAPVQESATVDLTIGKPSAERELQALAMEADSRARLVQQLSGYSSADRSSRISPPLSLLLTRIPEKQSITVARLPETSRVTEKLNLTGEQTIWYPVLIEPDRDVYLQIVARSSGDPMMFLLDVSDDTMFDKQVAPESILHQGSVPITDRSSLRRRLEAGKSYLLYSQNRQFTSNIEIEFEEVSSRASEERSN